MDKNIIPHGEIIGIPVVTGDWDKNTKDEMVAVDPGVQAELPKDARWYRRQARWALRGQQGLTHEQKIENLKQAREALDKAIALMQTGEI